MQAQPDLMTFDPALAALPLGDNFIFFDELIRRLLEGAVAFDQAGAVLAA